MWNLRFIIAGWLNVFNSCSSITIKNAYLKKENFNVIIVDWEDKSRDINYFYLSLTINKVAEKIATFTRYLNTSMFIPFSDIYLIGFSLGAQIAGLAGKEIFPNKFKTIFALDPAGPMFTGFDVDRRIDESDAEYVEAIQTNVGIAGFYGESGQASFYPNYGTNQLHCLFKRPSCNHAAAYEFFAESINANETNEFYAVKCENFKKLINLNFCNCKFNNKSNCEFTKMGGEPSVPKEGVFFLKTNLNSPYGLGRSFLKNDFD